MDPGKSRLTRSKVAALSGFISALCHPEHGPDCYRNVSNQNPLYGSASKTSPAAHMSPHTK